LRATDWSRLEDGVLQPDGIAHGRGCAAPEKRRAGVVNEGPDGAKLLVAEGDRLIEKCNFDRTERRCAGDRDFRVNQMPRPAADVWTLGPCGALE